MAHVPPTEATGTCVNDIHFVDSDGVRTLHFGTPAVQGAMRLDRPHDIELEYVQQMMMWMLFRQNTAHIVQLGLGAAALTKFCYQHLPGTKVTAVELNTEVIDLCHRHFALPPNDKRLHVLNRDALDYVSDVSHHDSIGVLQVDLYDAQAHGPLLSTDAFYTACHQCLSSHGIMTINLYCDWPEHLHHLQRIENIFEAVAWLPEVHDSNIVAIAFKSAPSVDFEQLYQRAQAIHAQYGLPAETWVDGLYRWMEEGVERSDS